MRNEGQPSWTFSGVAVYRPELFAGCKPGRFPLAPLLRKAAREGRIGGSVYEGFWSDAGTPASLNELNA